jgi:mycothiol synthase
MCPSPLPAPPALPALPLLVPAGWVARAPSAGDAPALYRLVAACDTAVLGYPDVALGDVEADLAADVHLQTAVFDEAAGSVTAEGADALAWVWMLDQAAGRTLADVYVDPALSPELGDALAAWAWAIITARAAQVGGAREVPATVLAVGSIDGDRRAESGLTAAGFSIERTFWRMRRRLSTADAAPRSADGVAVRRLATGDPERTRDLHAAYDVLEAAFVDHWDHHARSFEDWWEQTSTRFGFDLGLWWLAEVDGRPVGVLIGTSQMAEEDAIYVATLGARREARGRGVATSLLRHAFADGLERGWGFAKLNVDTESSTAAPSLYLGLGLEVTFAMRAWQRTVESAGTVEG